MTPMLRHVHAYTLPAALSLLPPEMDSAAARALLLTIGLQESGFLHRRQLPRTEGGPLGPARSLWQFEAGARSALAGLKRLPNTQPHLSRALEFLRYPAAPHLTVSVLQHLTEHNDTLACVCARLLLWTDRRALSGPSKPLEGWEIYLRCWRPGQPRRDSWDEYYRIAWNLETA